MADDPRDYKATTLLPKTEFPMKANLAEREPQQLAKWEAAKLYDTLATRGTKGTFLLHDGPPYANGHLHEGHFLNKILKDIVVKAALMRGLKSEYIPGWDCHGLPIELAVDKELGSKKRDMDKAAIRKACRAYAEKFIGIQRDEFKRLGVFGRWDSPYSTMDFGYEAQTVRELARVVRQGAVYRGKKPVYWCWNDRTALAEAEIEYQDDTGPSIYVGFEAAEDLGRLLPALKGKRARFAIWTTTPWTLPANLAIAVRDEYVYVAYELRGVATLVARDLLFDFLSKTAPEDLATTTRRVADDQIDSASLTHPERVLGYVSGKDLEGLTYRHPFLDRVSKVILGDHVTLEAGTGLVHTAPGHGNEDYEVGLKYGLPILVPVDAAGVLTAEAGPFAGQFIEKANPLIEQELQKTGALLNPPGQKISHSYPHCWRCKKPVILRATDQWFVSMEKTQLRERALAATENVRWIPAWGKDRIQGMLKSRPDWCISRQRTWGVPIPALYCDGCGEGALDPKVLDQVAERFEAEGADAWFTRTVDELAPGYRCAKCGSAAFTKENDILDVWFDSGVSQAAVMRKRLSWPADIYLEGSDQHRGWFQASLLCALSAGESESPFRECMTCGFVVDGQGRKLSKSLGNAVDPQKLLRQYGADVVRLWVASEDVSEDVRLSDEILQRLADGYRKLRNTLRFALGVLADFDPKVHAVPREKLAPIDRHLHTKLHFFLQKVGECYAAYDFHSITRAALDFVAVELSALHFDVSKDRLYCAAANSPERRSAQTVVFEVADALCRVMAPILSFTMEEAYGYLRHSSATPHLSPPPQAGEGTSVFLAGMAAPDPAALLAYDTNIEKELEARADVLNALEPLRARKVIGSSQQARVVFFGKKPPFDLSSAAELFIVSSVEYVAELSADTVPADKETFSNDVWSFVVTKAEGQKCDRCWNYRLEGEARHGGFVCSRCLAVLKTLGNS